MYLMSSCNPSKRVQEGEYLLMSNKTQIVYMDRHAENAPSKKEIKLAIKKDELNNLIRQKPNRKIFGISRLYLWFYNMINPQIMANKIEKKRARIDKKNIKRASKGKEEKEYGKTWREWFAKEIGELPVIYDSSLSEMSIKQMENYLYNKGFFHPIVDYEIKLDSNKRRAWVSYSLAPEIPHRINTMEYRIQNKEIESIINNEILSKDSLIYKEDRFDMNNLQQFQSTLTRKIRNHGFYLFNQTLVYFEADTSIGNYKVNLTLFVNDKRIVDEVSEEKPKLASYYKKYYVDNIFINTSYPAIKNENDEIIPYDTLTYSNKSILYQHRFRYQPKLFQRALLINKDSLYNVDETELTFKKLFELGSFDLVNISYNLESISDSIEGNLPLDAFINLNPAKNQSVSFETTTTNNGGFLGISGSVSYSHKNIFRGGEQLRITLSGGVEAQQSLNNQEATSPTTLNTIEISPQIELIFPHFIAPFSYQKFKRILNPKTSVSLSYNYQDQPDFKRTTTTSFFGYKWNSSDIISHQLNIYQISFTKIENSQAFQEYLDNLNNALLEASFSNNVIPSTRYIGTFNNQKTTFQKQVFYTRLTLQEAGIVTNLLYDASNATRDSSGSYLFRGIPFANFIKTEVDFRYYKNFDENNSLASRTDIGGAWTLQNLDVIPFQEAFFVGGANSNRAWRPRTLGPGSFFDSTGVEAFDKIGEVKIDLSLEYRFNLVSIIDLALFIDASNIWIMQRDGLDKDNPVVFNPDRFISEIAIGSGFGIRLNFNFFLIRFDFGLQTKDPSAEPGERWLWQPKTLYNQRIDNINELNGTSLPYYHSTTIFNIAIGYPF